MKSRSSFRMKVSPVALGLLCLSVLTGAGQITVMNNDDSGPGSLRQAIIDIPDGGIIDFGSGFGAVFSLSSGPLDISGKSITITSAGFTGLPSITRLPSVGGRLFEIDPSGGLTLQGIYMSYGKHPTIGGSILNEGTLIMEDCFVLFSESANGAGISNSGTLSMTDCWMSMNTACGGRGGAIHSTGTASLTTCYFTANRADEGGGAIHAAGALSLHQCELSGNNGGRAGGGIHLIPPISTPIVISESMISFNQARDGGGIWSFNRVDLIDSSIVENVAFREGGGLVIFDGFHRFTQCTIANNKALIRGGGLDIRGALAELRHCTLTDNSAPDSAGMDLVDSGKANVLSSIIAGNNGSDIGLTDPAASYTSMGHNVIGGGATGFFTAPGDQVAIADPGLAPLGYYGGPVLAVDPLGLGFASYRGGPLLTAPPMLSSPAVDAGGAAGPLPATDQIGGLRVLDGNGDASAVVDAGAIEADPSPALHLVVTDPSDSGPGTLRQAIDDALPDSFTHITFAPFLSGATLQTGSGELTIINKRLFIDAGNLADRPVLDADEIARVFTVAPSASLNLRNLTLREGYEPPPLDPWELFNYDGRGGGIRNFGAVTLDRCTITKCTGEDELIGPGDHSPAGGAIYHQGNTLRVTDCQLVNNTGRGGGGGVGCYQSGPVSISGTTISGNTGASGGGIDTKYVDSHLFLFDCHLTQNTAYGASGGLLTSRGGGGLRASAKGVTVIESTFSRNSAAYWGGGMYIRPNTVSVIYQTTFSGNSAGTAGGAIFVAKDYVRGSPEFFYCTISGNDAPQGGGIYVEDARMPPNLPASATLFSSIASGNTPADLEHGTGSSFVTAGYNLVGSGNGAAAFAATGDVTGVGDPVLAPLGDYGGNTPTLYPLPGSPVIDAGGVNDYTSTRDQRGFLREVDGDGDGTAVVDVGAVEYAPAAPVMVANVNDGGIGSLRQAIADSPLPGTPILFDPSLDGQTIDLTSGEIPVSGFFLKIDARSLPNGISVSGRNAFRVFHVPTGSIVEICALRIVDGFVFDSGGGILNEGTLTLRECTLEGNAAVERGGGIENALGTLFVADSTFLGNAAKHGAGLYSDGDFVSRLVTIDQCTFAENVADEYGGAIYNFLGRMTIRHSTVVGNASLVEGGGIANFGDLSTETIVFSSIVAGNNGNDVDFVEDPANNFTSLGFNLIGFGNAAAGAFTSTGDQIGNFDPLLASIGAYGGRTLTMPVRLASPARHAGGIDGSTTATDQRGFSRIAGTGIDVGAYEAGSPSGYAAWAAELVAPGFDDSFAGDADGDGDLNGYEYAIGTDVNVPDSGSHCSLQVIRPPGMPSVDLRFCFRPEAFDVSWILQRTRDFVVWPDIFLFDGSTATGDPGIAWVIDTPGRMISVTDSSSSAIPASYRLEVRLIGP